MLRLWNSVLFYSTFVLTSLILFAVIEWTSLTSWISSFLYPIIALYVSYAVSVLFWQQYDIRARLPIASRVRGKHKAVFITGCDSGFGLWLALDLLDRDFTVMSGCLSVESDGANRLRAHPNASNRLLLVPLDVTSESSVTEALQTVQNELRTRRLHLYALVNNAGIMASCEIEFGSCDLFERQLQVNCLGAIRVTKALLPLLRDASLVHQSVRDHPIPMDAVPRIINMCSLAGRHAIPGINSYCVSKAGFITFTQGLRRELAKWSIDVVSIEPHLFRTNLVYQERQLNDLATAWNESPECTRDAYGETYYQRFRTFVQKMLNTARGDVRLVVQVVRNSLLDPAPLTCYRVLAHPLERVRFVLYDLLPEALLDQVAHLVMNGQIGKPKAISIHKNT